MSGINRNNHTSWGDNALVTRLAKTHPAKLLEPKVHTVQSPPSNSFHPFLHPHLVDEIASTNQTLTHLFQPPSSLDELFLPESERERGADERVTSREGEGDRGVPTCSSSFVSRVQPQLPRSSALCADTISSRSPSSTHNYHAHATRIRLPPSGQLTTAPFSSGLYWWIQRSLTHTITLHPSYFGAQLNDFLTKKLYEDVEGTCSGKHG